MLLLKRDLSLALDVTVAENDLSLANLAFVEQQFVIVLMLLQHDFSVANHAAGKTTCR